MKLQLDLPGVVRVRDTTTYKGHSVTVLSVFGEDVAYYIGRSNTAYSSFNNSDWEGVFTSRVADFFGKLFVEEFPDDWSEENPTGREVDDHDPVIYMEVSD